MNEPPLLRPSMEASQLFLNWAHSPLLLQGVEFARCSSSVSSSTVRLVGNLKRLYADVATARSLRPKPSCRSVGITPTPARAAAFVAPYDFRALPFPFSWESLM